jgi:hypothetical protein
MALRWSTWSAQALAAVSCTAPGTVRGLAIADGPGNAPLLVCATWQEQAITLIDPAGEIQAQYLSGSRDSRHPDVMASRTGSGRIVAWSESNAARVRDLDRPDEPLRIGRTWRANFYLNLLSVADIGDMAIVVASERARWSGKPKRLLWNARTGRMIGELPVGPGEKGEFSAVTITSSAAGEPLLIMGERDGQIRVWDLPAVRLRRAFQCPDAYLDQASAFPRVGGGSAGDLTIVAAVWAGGLFCWRLETGELLHSTEVGYLDWRYDSRELVVGRVGARTVVAAPTGHGPVAFEADSGAPVPLLSYDRGPGRGATAAALRATPSGIVHAVAFGQQIRCHLLQQAPDDAGETGVEDVAAGTWVGRPAVLSRDIDGVLWARDLRTGELLERRDKMRYTRMGTAAGRIVNYVGALPVDVLIGEDAGPPLQVSWGRLDRAWWGSPDGEDKVAVGVLFATTGGSDAYTTVLIAVWDGTTGQLRSLRGTDIDHFWAVALAIGTVGGEPALVTAEQGRYLTVESLAADPVPRSELSRARWQVRRGDGRTGDAAVMLGDGYLAYSWDERIVRVVRCVRADGETRLEDATEIDVGARVNALAYAGEGQLVIGCGAGVQLVEIDTPE